MAVVTYLHESDEGGHVAVYKLHFLISFPLNKQRLSVGNVSHDFIANKGIPQIETFSSTDKRTVVRSASDQVLMRT